MRLWRWLVAWWSRLWRRAPPALVASAGDAAPAATAPGTPAVEDPASHLVGHPIWPELAPYLRVEVYARDGGHAHPRHRIECGTMPAELRERALRARVRCCACRSPMHPIRERRPPRRGATGKLYYAAACPLDVSLPCSRGPEAREDYIFMATALGGPVPPRQVALFGGEDDGSDE